MGKKTPCIIGPGRKKHTKKYMLNNYGKTIIPVSKYYVNRIIFFFFGDCEVKMKRGFIIHLKKKIISSVKSPYAPLPDMF